MTYGNSDVSDIPVDGYIPILRSNNIKNSKIDLDDLVYVKANKVNKKQFLVKGDILITASTGSIKVIGKNAFCDENLNASFGAFCKVVRAKNVHNSFLKHMFQSPQYFSYIQNVVNGSNINNIKNEHINNFKIPLPPIENQKKIAQILDDAAALRNKTKQLIKEYDALVQSIFLDMFGDPVKNEKKWSKLKFEHLVASDCPLSYGIVQPGEEFENGIPCVRPVDLTEQYIQLSTLKKIDPAISKRFKRTLLKGGEILLSVRGSVGVISIASDSLKDSNVTRGIVPIWFDSNISNKLFFFYLYKSLSIQRRLSELSKGATLIQLNLKDLRELELIQPPIELQNQFADKIALIEKQKELVKQELKESEDLFNCLLQKAFKDELV